MFRVLNFEVDYLFIYHLHSLNYAFTGYGKSHDEQKIDGTQGRISVERSGGGT